MKNIAIALDKGSPSKRNAITSYFTQQGLDVWHWIDDFWIIRVPDNQTPRSVQTSLQELTPVGTNTILVFEFKGSITFWGRAKNDAWEWLRALGKPG